MVHYIAFKHSVVNDTPVIAQHRQVRRDRINIALLPIATPHMHVLFTTLQLSSATRTTINYSSIGGFTLIGVQDKTWSVPDRKSVV